MATPFVYLPFREFPAAANMAEDLLLLESFPQPDALRFRHYGWSEPNSFTFGYSQPLDWVKSQLPVADAVAVRRPTGGGIVDHRNDWTYAFVIPAGHPMHRGKGTCVYQAVHEALAKALRDSGQPAELAPEEGKFGAAGLCFAAPEPSDVILPGTVQKLAGAAMKRNRYGLLVQGSIERATVPGILDWAAFEAAFHEALCERFSANRPETTSYPEWPAEARTTAHTRFQSDKWNGKR